MWTRSRCAMPACALPTDGTHCSSASSGSPPARRTATAPRSPSLFMAAAGTRRMPRFETVRRWPTPSRCRGSPPGTSSTGATIIPAAAGPARSATSPTGPTTSARSPRSIPSTPPASCSPAIRPVDSSRCGSHRAIRSIGPARSSAAHRCPCAAWCPWGASRIFANSTAASATPAAIPPWNHYWAAFPTACPRVSATRRRSSDCRWACRPCTSPAIAISSRPSPCARPT